MFIVTKEIDSENISKLCRTCLREDGDKMVCLFMGPAGSSLAAKLRSLSCLEVWQGDGLPEKMCDRCVTRAESALLYREQCRAADRALRQAALKVLLQTYHHYNIYNNVSGLTSYTTVSGCKLYQNQQNQGFVPVQNSHKTLKCIECGAVFMNYQELCAHSRLHLSFIQDNIPMQHMHIVESQNPYLNFGHVGSNFANDSIPNTQLSPLVRSNVMHTMPLNEESSSRAACALHCSLCNHTFTNRRQLISHNITHGTDNVDISCDNENIEICENSNHIPQNLSYERSIHSVDNPIQNLSYQRSTVDDNDEMQNLNFPENIDLDGVQESSSERLQNVTMHSENDVSIAENLRFIKASEKDRQHIIGYHGCPTDDNYKQPLDGKDTDDIHAKKHQCECDLKGKFLLDNRVHIKIMDEDDYGALRQKNISEREAFFAEFFKDLKEDTKEIKKIQKEQWNENYSENQQPKKRRRTITDDSESWKSGNIQFRRTYNTRSRRTISYIDGFNNSDDEDKENISLKDQSVLKVLFPWAKPFQRSIDLMKIVCDVDEEENENSEGYSDDYFNPQKRNVRHRVRRSEYDPDNVPSVDEITESMLKNVAKKSSKKTYCKVRGTSCHQCRQKTLDTKTVCRSGECIGVRGQFCGPCLRGRYGESAVEALKDPDWACPPCRGLCNCSICRNRNGLRPTGCLAPMVQNEGYASVKDYLQVAELQDI